MRVDIKPLSVNEVWQGKRDNDPLFFAHATNFRHR